MSFVKKQKIKLPIRKKVLRILSIQKDVNKMGETTTIGVTGAAGYVGSLLVRRLLHEKVNVVALDNFARPHNNSLVALLENKNFEFMKGDVSLPSDCVKFAQKVDAIVHLAAVVGVPECEKSAPLAFSTNFTGTENILAAKGDKPLVFASTGSVYGNIGKTCTEESPTSPVSIYGQTKLEAENMVLENNNTIALRFSTAYGISPNMRWNLLPNDLCYRAVHDNAIVLFQSGALRSFIHVFDMVDALSHCIIKLLMGIKPQHSVMNVGDSGLNLTKLQLAENIQKATNCQIFQASEGYVDPDSRDYNINFDRITEYGWKPSKSFHDGIWELVEAARMY